MLICTLRGPTTPAEMLLSRSAVSPHPRQNAVDAGLADFEPAGVRALWEAIDRYAVLVFHDQRLSDEQLRDFAGKFGKTADEALLVAGGTGIRTQGPTAMASSFGTRLIYLLPPERPLRDVTPDGVPWQARVCAKWSRATVAYVAAVPAGGSNDPFPRTRPR
jgi:hypothetical protein